jgi:hypothetical protein
MTEERWQSVERVFAQALALDPSQRAAFIAAHCPDDPELQHECARLLALDDQAERDRVLNRLRTRSYASPKIESAGPETAAPSGSGSGRADPSQEPGDRLGKYDVVRRLGHGSQGSALLARDPDLQTLVVLKVYDGGDAGADPELLLREGRALARVQHPSVARCLGVERLGGRVLLVVEYVPGRDLAAAWHESPGTIASAVRIMEQVAAGLAAVHACGLVHRDIKPSNVLLGDDGTPRIVDFGLAVPPGSDTGRVRSATPAYLAPEQARGEWELVDPRTDVFSLGATLYHLLTGRPPFQADTARATLRRAALCQFRPPRLIQPKVPRGLERICMRAMAAAPERRYASAAELEQALGRWRARPRRLAAVGAAVLLVLGLALFGGLSNAFRPSPTPAPVSGGLAGAAAPAEGPLRITRLDVEHLAKRSDDNYEPRGLLGEQSFAVKPGDDVRLRAALSAPGYAFLIAFRPDGVVEICDPEDPAFPPARTSQPQYPPPAKTDDVYRLEDGTGLQAFALVVSKDPLPSFNAWRLKAGAARWKAGLAGLAGVVWRHDGQRMIPRSRTDPTGQRGKGAALRGGVEVAALCDWLRAIPGIDAVEVVAFPVPPAGP